MRAAPVALTGLLASLVMSLTVVPPAAGGPVSGAPGAAQAASAEEPAAAEPQARKKRDKRGPKRNTTWVPRNGVHFNDPTRYGSRRVLLTRVINSIQAARAGDYVRLIAWNYDDRPMTTHLIDANRRGVNVQLVVSAVADNPNWHRIRQNLNRDQNPETFAVRCRGGCRSNTKIMHSKIYLFDRVNSAEKVTMFGSANLTTPAGNRQWNDLVTTDDPALYDYFVARFAEWARDRKAPRPYRVDTINRYQVTMYPVGRRNPVVAELDKVRCNGATGPGGSRTRIRIAIAGWFDAYGQQIANRIRQMWDRGCDIKIVTTLAGRGINQTLRNPAGRGPVPIRELSVDRNFDGIPERYLHMKAMAIRGVYNGNTSAAVVVTGSANWSTRAQRSEEVQVRISGQRDVMERYQSWIDRLYASPSASPRVTTRAELQAALARLTPAGRVGATSTLRDLAPTWLELD